MTVFHCEYEFTLTINIRSNDIFTSENLLLFFILFLYVYEKTPIRSFNLNRIGVSSVLCLVMFLMRMVCFFLFSTNLAVTRTRSTATTGTIIDRKNSGLSRCTQCSHQNAMMNVKSILN